MLTCGTSAIPGWRGTGRRAAGSVPTHLLAIRPPAAEVFHPDWPHEFFRHWLHSDPQTQVHWWGVMVQDRRLFSPGAHEAAQRAAGVEPYRGNSGPSEWADCGAACLWHVGALRLTQPTHVAEACASPAHLPAAVGRDSNLRLPWAPLEGLLRRIVALNGSTDAYGRLVAAGDIRVTVGEEDTSE